jgi:hypothetical protein
MARPPPPTLAGFGTYRESFSWTIFGAQALITGYLTSDVVLGSGLLFTLSTTDGSLPPHSIALDSGDTFVAQSGQPQNQVQWIVTATSETVASLADNHGGALGNRILVVFTNAIMKGTSPTLTVAIFNPAGS